MAGHAEFSRLIAIEGITPDKVRKEAIEASEAECAALAKRFDLRELSGLKARLNIRRVSGSAAVRVEGWFEADVIQTCVVSLQDVHGRVEGYFDTFFTEEAESAGAEPDITIDDDEISPEMITKGNIDLGEVVAQYLSLELDPYPRAPGVSLAAQLAEIGAEVKNSPFRVLEGLKSAEQAQKSAAGKQSKPVLKPAKAKKPAKSKSRKGKAE